MIALVLLLAACARPRTDDARRSRTATLLPADLALGFLQEIKSRPNRSLLAGEATIPPCRFTEKGTGSAGEYRKLTGQHASSQVTGYNHWTPRTARTVLGTSDHCIVGPTTEPVRKVVEALAALGVEVAPEYGYIVR